MFNNRNVGFVKIGFVIISKPRGHLFGTPPPGLELSYRCRRPSVHFDSYATRNANSLGLHGLYKPRDQKSYTRGRGYLRDAMYTTREISRQTNQRKWEDRLGEIYDRKKSQQFLQEQNINDKTRRRVWAMSVGSVGAIFVYRGWVKINKGEDENSERARVVEGHIRRETKVWHYVLSLFALLFSMLRSPLTGGKFPACTNESTM